MSTILLDKSAFEALRPEEHELLGRFTFQIIPPILVMEILGDAAKEMVPGQTPWIQVLARKFNGSGGPVAGEWELLMQSSLRGQQPPLFRQVPITHFEYRRATDGSVGLIIRDHPLNLAILRWASGQISTTDVVEAKRWRESEFLFDLDSFCEWVTGNQVSLPRARNAEHAVELAKNILHETGQAEFWIAQASRLSGHSDEQARSFLNRPIAPSASFPEAAPLASRMMLGFLSTLIAWQSGQLRNDLNNAKDAMYFAYLPFAACFVSDDRLHQRLAPGMMDESQVFLSSTELRADLVAIQQVLNKHSVQLSHGLPDEVRELADRSKLIKALCRYLQAPSTNASGSGTSKESIIDRLKNAVPIDKPADDEGVHWIAIESIVPRSVAEQRYGELNLPSDEDT